MSSDSLYSVSSAAGRKFLAPPYHSQRAVFASLWALFHSCRISHVISSSPTLIVLNTFHSFPLPLQAQNSSVPFRITDCSYIHWSIASTNFITPHLLTNARRLLAGSFSLIFCSRLLGALIMKALSRCEGAGVMSLVHCRCCWRGRRLNDWWCTTSSQITLMHDEAALMKRRAAQKHTQTWLL